MVLTKQLQVLIQSSLAQGRDYDDIRAILLKQGFQEGDITQLFSDYRGGAGEGAPAPPVTPPPAPAAPSTFTPPKVKQDFVPVGFEKDESLQGSVNDDVNSFMNVGTNTHTARDILLKQESVPAVKAPAKQKLPAPGTTLLPNELNAMQNSFTSYPNTTQLPNNTPYPNTTQLSNSSQNEPKVFNEQGVAQGEQPQAYEAPVAPQKVDTNQKYINIGLAGMPEIEKVLQEEQAKRIEKSPWPLAIVLIFLLAMIGGSLYWWFFIFNSPSGELTESEKLLQELQNEKTQEIEVEAETQTPPEPTGPIDPFTGQVVDFK